MPARDEQQQIGKVELRIGQPRGQRMALEMVDRDQRLVAGHRQRLGGDQPTITPPISPGPAVAATASTSASSTPASASTPSISGGSISTWARAAISGTTPP